MKKRKKRSNKTPYVFKCFVWWRFEFVYWRWKGMFRPKGWAFEFKADRNFGRLTIDAELEAYGTKLKAEFR